MPAKNETATVKFTRDAKTIGKFVDSVLRRAKTITRDIHIVGVSTLIHAAEHGDITLMTKLVDGLPGGFRKSALLKWFIAHGPVVWNPGDKKAEDKALRKGRLEFSAEAALPIKERIKADLDGLVKELSAVNFGDWDKEPEFDGYDQTKALFAVLNKAEKIAKDPEKANHPKTDISLLDQLREMLKGRKAA